MAANQPPWPSEWLMTDERIGDRLWQAIDALPIGRAGIVFRHYSLATGERTSLAHRIAGICRDRGLTLAIGQDIALARTIDAQMVHNPVGNSETLPVSRAAHSPDEARAACYSGASLVFLSPMFPTRSHPEREPLSPEVVREIVASCPVPVIALGGMNRARFAEIERHGFHGWAGIDAWLGEQSRT